MHLDFLFTKKDLHKNNFLIVVFFVFIFLFSFTPSLHGQTKKKTIQWINTNGVSLSKIENTTSSQNDFPLYFSILEVDKDSIHYVNNMDNNLHTEIKHSILLKDVLYENIETLEKRSSSNPYNITNFVIKVRSISRDGRNKKTETVTDFYFPFEDEEKASRVVKAIMDLARLNGAKENKQYY